MNKTKTSIASGQMKRIGIFSAVTGKRMRMFTYQTDAAKWLGCTQANVCYALGGKLKTCKGRVVRWCDSATREVEPVSGATRLQTRKSTAKSAKNTVKRGAKACARKIALFSVRTGKRNRVFRTSADAARFLGVNPSNVCRALSGEHSSCKNYTLKYV